MGAVSTENQAVLADAVARNCGIVLSLPSAGIVRHFKSRFLGDVDEGIWAEADPESILQVKELIETQKALAVSFKGSVIRMGFAARAIRFEPSFRINAESTVPAVLLSKPAEVKGIQRRNAYRVRVRPENELVIRIWSVPEHAFLSDRPMAVQEVKIQLIDISIGGIGVSLEPTDGKTHKLVADQRLRIQIKYRLEEEFLLEGRLRGEVKPSNGGKPLAGIVFKKLENDVEGRQKLAMLTRIVGEMQREEARRSRLGLAS